MRSVYVFKTHSNAYKAHFYVCNHIYIYAPNYISNSNIFVDGWMGAYVYAQVCVSRLTDISSYLRAVFTLHFACLCIQVYLK